MIHSLKLVDYFLAQADKPWYNYYVLIVVRNCIVVARLTIVKSKQHSVHLLRIWHCPYLFWIAVFQKSSPISWYDNLNLGTSHLLFIIRLRRGFHRITEITEKHRNAKKHQNTEKHRITEKHQIARTRDWK